MKVMSKNNPIFNPDEIIKREARGIKAIQEVVLNNNKGQRCLNNLHGESEIKEYDPNRKF